MARGDQRARSAARRSTAVALALASARSSCSGSSTGGGPSGSATLDLLALVSFSVSLWFFNHGNVFAAMPLAYPPLVWVLARCVWIARGDRPARGAPVWPVWLLARGDGLPRRLPGRAQRARVERDRRRLLRRDRRRPHLARRRARTATSRRRTTCRSAGRRTVDGRGPRPRPDERPLRDREPARRHVRAGLVPRLHPGLPDVRLEPQVGHAAGGALHVDPVRPARAARARCSSAGGSAGRESARPPRSPGRRGRSRSTPRARTRTTRSRRRCSSGASLRSTSSTARGAAVAALRLDEVRVAARAPAVVRLSRSAAAAPGRVRAARVPARDGRRLLRAVPRAVAVARRPRLLRPHGRFQVGRDSPFSLWDWRQYHAKGLPDLHLVQRVLEGAARGRRARARFWVPRRRSPLRMAAFTAARADRLRARADALVLSLPAVVLPVRRARACRTGPGNRA